MLRTKLNMHGWGRTLFTTVFIGIALIGVHASAIAHPVTSPITPPNIQSTGHTETIGYTEFDLSAVPDNQPTEEYRAFIQMVLEDRFSLPIKHAMFLADNIAKGAYLYEHSPKTLIALIVVESYFNPKALSHADAWSYTQVIPKWWRWESPHDLFTPEGNILTGAFILYEYRKKCGGEECALRAYNIGITNYLKGLQLAASQRYIDKINAARKRVYL